MNPPSKKDIEGVRVLLDALLAGGGTVGDLAKSIARQIGLSLEPVDLDLSGAPVRVRIRDRIWVLQPTQFQIDAEPMFSMSNGSDIGITCPRCRCEAHLDGFGRCELPPAWSHNRHQTGRGRYSWTDGGPARDNMVRPAPTTVPGPGRPTNG